jgi:hypothetical protein
VSLLHGSCTGSYQRTSKTLRNPPFKRCQQRIASPVVVRIRSREPLRLAGAKRHLRQALCLELAGLAGCRLRRNWQHRAATPGLRVANGK